MLNEKQLLLALDMLTVGSESEIVPERLTAAADTTQKEQRSWVRGAGVQGYGIGEKISDQGQLKEVVLKIYVEKKLPENKLKDAVLIPKAVYVEGLNESVATDVVEIGKMKKEANTTRVRPAIPGFSIGLTGLGDAGTLGCLVKDAGDADPDPQSTSRVYILSNSHVLANEGIAAAGHQALQAGELDGGAAPADVLGKLVRSVPFTFSTTAFDNLVDAAVAEVRRREVASAIRLIGIPTGVGTRLRRGMRVQKTGRTTDYTVGIIQDINFRTALPYKKPGGGTGRVGFRDQVLCTRYTAAGDSGAAVLNMRKQIVGLHFAGSPSTSVFNKIEHVLTGLGIAIITT
jgi:hypothetical protein